MSKSIKKRLNLSLTPEAYSLLQRLSDESGRNMADVLRTGLTLYALVQEEKQKGNSISITDQNNSIVSRILIP